MRDDLGGDDLGVERAAARVDVAAVGRGVGEDDSPPPRVELGEELGRDGAGGAVGAVDDDAAAVEGEVGDGGEQEADVFGAIGLVDLDGAVVQLLEL